MDHGQRCTLLCMSHSKQTVLITGASTGIGRDGAISLAREGFHVWAGVRQEEDAQSLRKLNIEGLEPVILDVTDAVQIEDIGRRAEALPNGLLAVINNAGYNYNAAFEFQDASQVRALFEVNYFGLVGLTQRLIPALRRYAAGDSAKIVNISSIGGSFGLPWEVHYHGTKFAVVGLTEGLRMELWDQNIRAVVVQPGGIRTEFMRKTNASIEAALAAMPEEGRARYQGIRKLQAQVNLSARLGSPPAKVSQALVSIIKAKNPRFRWLIGPDARLLYVLHRLLPFWLMHQIFRKLFIG
jgi:NAD(P)-dependent dehydrogenase (short-subunit alcohol dehydrogenase family)